MTPNPKEAPSSKANVQISIDRLPLPSSTGNDSSPQSATSLEALMSPLANQVQFQKDSRTSLVESEFDTVGLDDDRFSTVTLSKDSSESDHTPSPPSEVVANELPSSHKKTASTTTIRDSDPSFKPHFPNDDSSEPNRESLERPQSLQDELSRLQKGDEQPATIDWDFWGEVISDYQKIASEKGDVLAEAITRGIPQSLRGMMWQHMAASKDPELEATYSRLLKESSPHEKLIIRDLGRAFPHHEYFTEGKGVGQENLFNVLKAYSLYDSQVGYCQGMHFIVAILLLNMPDEEAFSLLVRLMHVYDLRGHFLPDMPKLQQRLFQFDRLVEDLLPVLHVHFLRQGVKSSMFCSQWFLTMFSYRFPLPVVFRIYDNCLASGVEAMFGFSVALLHQNEEKLLKMKFDELMVFLNKNLLDLYLMNPGSHPPPDSESDAPLLYDVDRFVEDAVNLSITPFMLENYAHEYNETVRQSTQQILELEELRTNNRNLMNQVKSLEDDMAQVSTEHVELLNELVKLRLRQEETEEELVRYKLLYAEAMHTHEDSQSKHNRSSSNASRSSGFLMRFS